MLRASRVVAGAELRLACEGCAASDQCIAKPELTELETKLLRHIGEKKWRGEVGMCLGFGGAKFSIQVQDALFRLVNLELIEWFGAEDTGWSAKRSGARRYACERPLRYRITEKGRSLKWAPIVRSLQEK